jgi:hypothetical protein
MAPGLVTRALVMQHPTNGIKRVAGGFCWPACLLGPLWAIAKRLWLISLLLVLALLPIILVDEYAEAKNNLPLTVLALGLYISYMFICGKYGNRWVSWTLQGRGYQLLPDENQP